MQIWKLGMKRGLWPCSSVIFRRHTHDGILCALCAMARLVLFCARLQLRSEGHWKRRFIGSRPRMKRFVVRDTATVWRLEASSWASRRDSNLSSLIEPQDSLGRIESAGVHLSLGVTNLWARVKSSLPLQPCCSHILVFIIEHR